MVNSVEFAKRLQKILDHYSISATAFSDEIEVNRSTISHLLSGRNKPSLDFVMKVVRHYPEVELYWLLNGKGSFPSTQDEKPTEIPVVSPPPDKVVPSGSENDIERIVIFYKDGSFKAYKP